ncbi:MAG: RluA family pseudouridine synthase [Lachnospiraceae bacterium]|nr:RluA family pseudouridine synthase [Lachnospiraceae bacterium]
MEEIKFVATEADAGIRLDKYIALNYSEVSRSYVQKLIESGGVWINGNTGRSKDFVKDGDEIKVLIPDPEGLEVDAEDIPLDILYEDDDLIVVNKPKGMVVHPAAGHYTGTLVNGLLYHCKGTLSGINGILRPGIVHRIDKDTTGILVACKNDAAHRSLAEQFKEHTITRRYDALVYGVFKEPEGRVESFISRNPEERMKMMVNPSHGKYAATKYRVKEQFGNKYSHIVCELETGRTHQIRVHMTSLGHPLLGDTVYGPKKDPFQLTGQSLHAGVLGFEHPTTKEYMEFASELPDYFCELIQKFRNQFC